MNVKTEKKTDETFTDLCSRLDYTQKNGLIISDADAEGEYQKYIFKQAKEKLGADAVFFFKPETGQSIPLIYFYKLESRDYNKIAELHKLAWNLGQAPLLFVILPGVVLIYNSYEKPRLSDNGLLDYHAGFIEELNLFIEAKRDLEKLNRYRSSELLTGSYWQKYSEYFHNKERVYQTLLENLEYMRNKLIAEGMRPEVVHNLLTRSIFIKYLEDRKDKDGYIVFPKGFFENYLPGAKSFTDLLSNKDKTEELFQYLNNKFNGDVFTLDEIGTVSQEHLNLLKKMLKGDMYLEQKQMTLWPLYSFAVSPNELISNIYQRFVRSEENEDKLKKKGTHYTPYHLVTFLMDQILPWEGRNTDLKVLDPSCGSGVFLVESYRRLISRWMQANPNKSPSISDLKRILKENIFGVDVNNNAIRIAALSLYLTMCDYLEPRYIWNQVRFDPIINENLFKSDFFEKDAPFLKKKYDIIIGNPPWVSKLPASARDYLTTQGRIVGDNQFCQAFLWRVSDLCKSDGEICMLVSSKSLLFNRSNTNRKFREQFFSSFNIKTIINFSSLRHILFSEAVGPPAAVIFSPEKKDTQNILYCSPKPSFSPQDDWLFIIEPQDIAHIPKYEAIENDIIWKVAMWGNPRDYELIKRFLKLPTLEEICKEKRWIHGEGYIEGGEENKKHEVPELIGKPNVEEGLLKKFTIDEDSLPSFKIERLYRSAKKKRKIFQGPHLLIKQSPTANVGMIAALLINDAVFTDHILGIHGKESDLNHLALCSLLINTDVALYYEILTSRSWLVERDFFQKEEIMDIPMPENILESKEINYDFLKEISENPEADKIAN
ncbi:MAG: N-6 DNA methylase, partial [Candidatus Methanoperedens sp.]|nr:N-6 DNA methylase [Candidatus Methanoperedens sp.]